MEEKFEYEMTAEERAKIDRENERLAEEHEEQCRSPRDFSGTQRDGLSVGDRVFEKSKTNVAYGYEIINVDFAGCVRLVLVGDGDDEYISVPRDEFWNLYEVLPK